MSAPKKIYLSKLVMAGAEILDKPVSDDDVEYIRADIIRDGSSEIPNDQPLPEDTVLFNKGVAEGRRLESEENKDRDIVFWRGIQYAREMMMKEARNHFVLSVLSGNDMKKMIEIYNDEADCKPGDVVRVIIFKKEGEK